MKNRSSSPSRNGGHDAPALLPLRGGATRRGHGPVPRQLPLSLPTWGGKRKGAGRKPVGKKAGVPHRSRPALASRFPVHVSLKVRRGLGSLRSPKGYDVILEALVAVAKRKDEGFRVCHHSVQTNHIHFIVEARDALALSRGIQGLSIRIARGLNRLFGHTGRVFADRFFSRILRTPREVRACLAYVLNNAQRHRRRRESEGLPWELDRYSNAATFDGWRSKPASYVRILGPPPVVPPHTWLLSKGWRRWGLLVPTYG